MPGGLLSPLHRLIRGRSDKIRLRKSPKIVALFRPTSASTDLDAFPTATDYFKAVSKETKGKYNRAANKARRLGYKSQITGRDAYARSLWKIRRSMLYRSRGPVYETFNTPMVEYRNSTIPFKSLALSRTLADRLGTIP